MSDPTQENHAVKSSPTPDDCSPFFPPLEEGYELINEFECVCDYDFYHTGLDERANGCGGIYYRRISISPTGLVINERTPCKCLLQYRTVAENREMAASMDRHDKWLKKTVENYFGPHNMLNDIVYRHMTLDRYQPQTSAQREALNYLRQYDLKQGGICLYGLPGRGKTHLALGLARKIQSQGRSVLAIKSIDLLARLKKTYESRNEDKEAAILNILKQVDLLVIDDIGTEKPTAWVKEKMYEIVDTRYKRKATVFTTNLGGDEMAKSLGEAMASRIWGAGKQLHIDGVRDWRVA